MEIHSRVKRTGAAEIVGRDEPNELHLIVTYRN
jgi:hypothetical protein